VSIEASYLLDEHHEHVGVSAYGDDIDDNCEVCPYAVGWRDDDTLGHDTEATVDEVREWIASQS
jgi:hypothetical protein